MKEKGLTLNYSLMICSYWMGYAVLNVFASFYLLDAGFSNTVIGILIAVAGGSAAILQPLVSSYADKPNSLPLKMIQFLTGMAILIIGILLFPARAFSIVLTAVLYTVGMALLQTMLPIVNALAMDTLNQGKRLNFGFARSTGSVGYAIVSCCMGIAAECFGAQIVPVMTIVMFGLFAFFSIRYPLEKAADHAVQEKTSAQSSSVLAFFKKYPRYSVMLIGLILVYTSHVAINNYALQIAVSKGGSSAEMGIVTALAALFEVPVMCLSPWLLKHFRANRMVILSAFFFFVKTLATLLVPDIISYYAVQGFQFFAWGLIAVTIVYYVDSLMAPEDSVKGQGYATMANALGYVVGAVIGGRLLDISVNAMLIFASAAAAAGAVIILFTARQKS